MPTNSCFATTKFLAFQVPGRLHLPRALPAKLLRVIRQEGLEWRGRLSSRVAVEGNMRGGRGAQPVQHHVMRFECAAWCLLAPSQHQSAQASFKLARLHYL